MIELEVSGIRKSAKVRIRNATISPSIDSSSDSSSNSSLDQSPSILLIIAIGSEREKFIAHLLASLTAGGTSTMVTNPIWVIKTRLMSQVSRRANNGARPPWHYKSTWDAARKMYHNEGILSFYSGLTPALLGLTHVAVQFPLYEYFRVKFTGRSMGHQDVDGNESQWIGIFAASILSKVCASSATYPHEVLRTRLQTQQRSFPVVSEEGVAFRGSILNPGDHGRPPGASSSDGMRTPPRYHGLVRTFRTILKEEGWRAFYAGMGTNMFRAVPAAVTTMLTFEYTMGRVKWLQAEGTRKMELQHQHIA
jgi:solute carrier family 25 folate transporter 32